MTSMQLQPPPPSTASRTRLGYRAPIGQPVRHRKRPHHERWVALVALLMISVGFLLPFAWMISTSLKSLDKTMEFPPRLIPDRVELHKVGKMTTLFPENYYATVTHEKFDFPLFSRNTLIIACLAVAGTVISSSVVAYGFAKIRFPGRGVLFGLMLSTMMIPFPVLMVSLFSIFRFMGDHTPLQMLGTFRPLWLPAFFGSAFNIFLLRQFFLTIPDELSEAARIDGCSEMGIFVRIILPLSKPALIVVALFTFMAAWNDFLGPLVYIQDPSQYTLALGLQTFSSQSGNQWNLLMAASVLIIAPVIILFFLAQKTFIQGIATTGMKG